MAYTSEKCFKIWDDEAGYRFEVGPDADGLDLLEIRFVDSVGKIQDRIVFDKEAARLICDAIEDLL
jgi:hypothetical protein